LGKADGSGCMSIYTKDRGSNIDEAMRPGTRTGESKKTVFLSNHIFSPTLLKAKVRITNGPDKIILCTLIQLFERDGYK
jgi:hypothetical protein